MTEFVADFLNIEVNTLDQINEGKQCFYHKINLVSTRKLVF